MERTSENLRKDVQNRRKVMLMAHHVKKPEVAVRFTNQLQGRRVVE
jgi:hypothetical protein